MGLSLRQNLMMVLSITMTAFLITVVFSLGISYYKTVTERNLASEGMKSEEKSHEAKQKEIEMRIEPSGVVCPFDSRWMEEAIGNLMDNAIKYSPCGGQIEIFVTKYGLFWCIHVRDQGSGIRESEQGLIFQRFYRSERAYNEPGLGIGLYLAREIVRLHGGYMEVRSKEGEGAEFCVYLPRD